MSEREKNKWKVAHGESTKDSLKLLKTTQRASELMCLSNGNDKLKLYFYGNVDVTFGH